MIVYAGIDPVTGRQRQIARQVKGKREAECLEARLRTEVADGRHRGTSDALLCAPAIPSLPHLSLEPVHQRGWGSVDAALARGRIDSEQLRDLLVRAGALPARRRPTGVRR